MLLPRLPGLVPAVGRLLVAEMRRYAVQPEHLSGYVVEPGLGVNAGMAGALALAMAVLGTPAPG